MVDPRVLADYVVDFRAILDEYGVSYGMFGHIDVGCLHVRPALDLTDPDDERIMREITTRVAQLAESYGGLLWNEHGKGFRSEYNRPFFGEQLYAALGDIKRAFDPHNQLNPGKIVALEPERVPLAAMDAPTRGTFDRQIPADERAAFPGAMQCNGNGACFDYDPTHVMCPSYRATRDRLHSPKGRAGAMREWLRQLAETGTTTADLAPAESPLAWRAMRDMTAGPADPEARFFAPGLGRDGRLPVVPRLCHAVPDPGRRAGVQERVPRALPRPLCPPAGRLCPGRARDRRRGWPHTCPRLPTPCCACPRCAGFWPIRSAWWIRRRSAGRACRPGSSGIPTIATRPTAGR